MLTGKEILFTAYKDAANVSKTLDGQLLTIPDAKHAIHFEYPEKVNKAIIPFLQEI